MRPFPSRLTFPVFSITLRSLIHQALLESEVVTSPINFTAKLAETAKDSATAFIPTLFLNPLRALCVLCGFIVKLTAEYAEVQYRLSPDTQTAAGVADTALFVSKP